MLTVIEGGRKESEEKAQRKREILIESYRRQFFFPFLIQKYMRYISICQMKFIPRKAEKSGLEY